MQCSVTKDMIRTLFSPRSNTLIIKQHLKLVEGVKVSKCAHDTRTLKPLNTDYPSMATKPPYYPTSGHKSFPKIVV